MGETVDVDELDDHSADEFFFTLAGLTDRKNASLRATVRDINGSLGNIPLAIELVAPQAEGLALATIKTELEKGLSAIAAKRSGIPERHQKMEAVLEFSYRNLSEPAKLLLRRISVFAGGAAGDAIGAVCELKDWQRPAVELTDRRLLRFDGNRYSLNPVVRQYAREGLDAEGQVEQFESRWSTFFSGLAAHICSRLSEDDASVWLRVLSVESDNLQGAIRWYEAKGNPQGVVSIADDLDVDYARAGLWTERRDVLVRAMAAIDKLGDRTIMARALHELGMLEMNQGEYAI